MPDDVVVPEGWSPTTLGSIGQYLNGRAFKSNEWSKTGRPIIRIQDLTGSNRNPNYFKGEVEDRYVVRPGDFLISWSATLGAYIWDGPEGVLNQHIFKVASAIDKRFHYHLVRQRIAELERSAHGSGMVHITKGLFDDTPVAVPDDPEVQRLLADVIDRAEALRDSSRSHLAGARRAIERFRQAILAAACSGRLTADWRDTNPARPDAVNEILKQCSSSRAGRARPSDFLRIPPEYELPELPDGWRWHSLSELTVRIADADHKMPKAQTDGTPYISTKDFTASGIDFDNAKLINDEDFAILTKKIRPQRGDMLLSRYGTVGEVRLVETDQPFQASYSIAIVKTVANEVLRDWLALNLRSVAAQRFMRDHIRASAQPDLGLQHIRQIPIAVAPPEEQAEVIRRVVQLVEVCDRFDARVKAAYRHAERSSQAVLAKAFRGELTESAT